MQILSVVIGLIFVLLLLSLLATTIMELLSGLFRLRARNMVRALRNMLANEDRTEEVLKAFRANSLYKQLVQRYDRPGRSVQAPSYMTAETFQSILFDVILKGDDVDNMQQRISQLPDADLRNVLNQLLRESGGRVDRFRLEVQNWYNNVMDRAAGWYKRYTQKIVLFVGLGIAVIFNADTVDLYDRLSNDPEVLAELVEAAEGYIEARERAQRLPPDTAPLPPQPYPDGTYPPAPPNGYPTQAPPNGYPTQAPPGGADAGGNGGEQGQGPSFGNDYVPINPLDTTQNPPTRDRAQNLTPSPRTYDRTYGNGYGPVEDASFQESLTELKGLLNNEIAQIRRPLGLGWEGVELRSLGAYDLISKLLGFILTALAVSLGAPFWFDLLKKLVNIRNAGGRPYEQEMRY